MNVAMLLAGLHRRGPLDAETLDALLDESALAAAITCGRRGADPPTAEDLRAHRPAD